MPPNHPPRVPVIDCTDLYHPHQDPGDNFDILAAYALPEIDLRAVILDTTNRFRSPCAQDPSGPREPGIIPMIQLNYIFDRTVPFAVSPFEPLRSCADPMREVPRFQQAGIELLLQTLREASEPVVIMVFCSCRTLAAALNREPELLRQKVRRVLLSIGTTSGEMFDVDYSKGQRLPPAPGSRGYLEWNVDLDPRALVRVLRSGLPMSLYPCASDGGPFALHRHNSFYQLGTRQFIRRMHPRLRSYLAYALGRGLRHDFLAAMDQDAPADILDSLDQVTWHPVWETALWLEVSGRQLVRHADGTHRLVPAAQVQPGDQVYPNAQRPCALQVRDDGRFDFTLLDHPSPITVYDRGDDLEAHARAMSEALQALYLSFAPPTR